MKMMLMGGHRTQQQKTKTADHPQPDPSHQPRPTVFVSLTTPYHAQLVRIGYAPHHMSHYSTLYCAV